MNTTTSRVWGAAVLVGGSLLLSGAALAPQALASSAMVTCNGQVVTDFVPAGGALYAPPNPGANNVIWGTPGPDNIAAGGGNDTICGRGEDDRIFGQGGDDDMFGDDGNDVLNGGPHMAGDRGNGGLGMDNCPNTEFVVNCP